MKYLLDSDVIIEILRENTKVASLLKELYLKGNILMVSPVTKFDTRDREIEKFIRNLLE